MPSLARKPADREGDPFENRFESRPSWVPDFLQGVLTDGFQGTGYLHLFYGARLDRQECN